MQLQRNRLTKTERPTFSNHVDATWFLHTHSPSLSNMCNIFYVFWALVCKDRDKIVFFTYALHVQTDLKGFKKMVHSYYIFFTYI